MGQEQVCRGCGVAVVQSKMRGWVHTAEIPRGTEEHEADPIALELWEAVKGYDAMSTSIAEARLYAANLREQMQREEMAGVTWNDQTRHTVVLLDALEAAEEVTVKAVEDAQAWKAAAARRVKIVNDPPGLEGLDTDA